MSTAQARASADLLVAADAERRRVKEIAGMEINRRLCGAAPHHGLSGLKRTSFSDLMQIVSSTSNGFKLVGRIEIDEGSGAAGPEHGMIREIQSGRTHLPGARRESNA